MSMKARYNREIEFETDEEPFLLGEKGMCDYLYPAIQSKADEHWNRIRNMIFAYLKDKESIADNENARDMSIRFIPKEEKLYEVLWDAAESYDSEVILSTVKRMAEELEDAKRESEEEDRSLTTFLQKTHINRNADKG